MTIFGKSLLKKISTDKWKRRTPLLVRIWVDTLPTAAWVKQAGAKGWWRNEHEESGWRALAYQAKGSSIKIISYVAEHDDYERLLNKLKPGILCTPIFPIYIAYTSTTFYLSILKSL
jgi:hypothetical protein